MPSCYTYPGTSDHHATNFNAMTVRALATRHSIRICHNDSTYIQNRLTNYVDELYRETELCSYSHTQILRTALLGTYGSGMNLLEVEDCMQELRY